MTKYEQLCEAANALDKIAIEHDYIALGLLPHRERNHVHGDLTPPADTATRARNAARILWSMASDAKAAESTGGERSDG